MQVCVTSLGLKYVAGGIGAADVVAKRGEKGMFNVSVLLLPVSPRVTTWYEGQWRSH
jgi:hypothetical protein